MKTSLSSLSTIVSTALLSVSALLASTITFADNSNTPHRITLAGWSKPISEITHVLAEPELQFFANENVELQYLPGAGGGDALRNLLSGQADVAFTDPGSFFAAVDKGAKLRAIYDVYPQNVFNVVTLANSPIKTANDLKGKRIGVYSLSSGTLQNLQLLLQQANIREDEVEIIVTGLLNFGPLMQKQVDATAATDTGLIFATYRGLEQPNVIEVADYINYSSDLFVVREEDFEAKKTELRHFLQAYQKATEWMIAHPKEAAQFASKYAIDGQDAVLSQQIIEARNRSSLSPYTEEHGLGAIDTVSLQAAADAYHELGLIKTPLDITSLITNELLNPEHETTP